MSNLHCHSTLHNFYCYLMVLHTLIILQFIYPFSYPWAFWWFPTVCCYKYHLKDEHDHNSFSRGNNVSLQGLSLVSFIRYGHLWSPSYIPPSNV